MRVARSGFVVAGIGVVVSVLMATSQAGASRPVLEDAAPAAPAAAVTTGADDAPSLASYGDQPDQGRADQTDTHCPGRRHACGILGRYVCCDFETECCRRKPHKTYCAPKGEKECAGSKPAPPAPAPVPVPSPR